MVTASTAPPGPRSVLVPKESVRAVRRGFAGRSSELMTAAKRPPAPVDPWAMREHRPSPGTSSSDANNLSKFLSAHCNGKDPPNKERIRHGEHVGYTSDVISVGMRCHYERDRTGNIHAYSVEIIENRIALCAVLNARVYDHPGLNVRAVIAFKVGNDAESIVNAGQRFLCDQSQMSVLTGRIFGGPQRSHPTRRPDHSSTSESGRRRRTARIPAEPGESDSPQRVGRRTISCVIGTGAASALRDRCGAKRLGRAGLSAVRCIGDCELHLAGVVGRGVEGPVVEQGRCLLVEEDAGAVLFEHLIADGGRRHQGEREGVRRRVIGDAHAAALGQFRVRGEVADLSGGVIGQREHRRTSLRPFVSDADARRFPSRIPDAVAVG
jgi:hypothetical protein